MDRLTSQALMSSGRRVTRGQLSAIKDTFPFFELPAELRNEVYAFSIDLSTLERFFDFAYRKLIDKKNRNGKRLTPQKKTPTIFLINKQIFLEAAYMLRKDLRIEFAHGLLKAGSISNVISANILRQVSFLDITDNGHPIIKGSILPTSWNGYMTLLTELGDILAEDHNLKALSIDFKDKRLEEHMTNCYDAHYSCGFRDQMHKALQSLRKVRNIGKVTLLGLNARAARELKWLMEKTPTTFLSLPRELRDMIYEDTMDISDISKVLARRLADYPAKTLAFPFPERTTPTVLLLNKQITKEALEMLHSKPVNITFTAKHSITDQGQIPSILAFVSRATLKQVKSLSITMDSWEWMYNIEDRLIKTLASSKKLENFHFIWHDKLKSSFTSLPSQRYPDLQVNKTLKKLANIRGLKQVTISGDLPVVYSDALAAIMTSKLSTQDSNLPKLKAVTGDGRIVDVDG